MLARLAMEKDEEAVVNLARMQVQETLPHLDFREDAARETFEQAVRHGEPTIFVAEDRGEIVGFLMAFLQGYAFTDGIHVIQEAIYVRPDRRGSTAAARLTKLFVEWGREVGAKEIIFGIANRFQPDRTARFFELVAGAEVVGFYLKRYGG